MSKIRLFGFVGSDFDARMLSDFLVQANGGDVEIEVYSKGGDLFEGYAMYSLLVNHAGSVTVTVLGLAASAGSLFIMGADKIRMVEGSWLMIHNAKMGFHGDSEEMKDSAEKLGALQEPMVMAYSKRTKIDADKMRELMKAETWYDANSAKEAGFVDEVISFYEDEDNESKEAMKAVAKLTLDDAKKLNYTNLPDLIHASIEKAGEQKPKQKEKVMDERIIASLNLPEKATPDQVVERINSLSQDKASLTAQLTTKDETLTAVKAELKTQTDKLAELSEKIKAQELKSLVDKAIDEAGVEVSAETRSKLEKRAEIHASLNEDGQKEIYSDMVLVAKHSGVVVGEDEDLSGGETARLKTGEAEPEDSANKIKSSLDYEKQLEIALVKAEKENPNKSSGELMKIAQANLK